MKNNLLKIYWSLEGQISGQTLPMFGKTKNLIPLPSKNAAKVSSQQILNRSLLQNYNLLIHLTPDTYS